MAATVKGNDASSPVPGQSHSDHLLYVVLLLVYVWLLHRQLEVGRKGAASGYTFGLAERSLLLHLPKNFLADAVLLQAFGTLFKLCMGASVL